MSPDARRSRTLALVPESDMTHLEFDEVALTPELVAELEAQRRRRWSRRTRFDVLNDALVHFGIHSLGARRVVRDWTREFFADPEYRRTFAIYEPFVPATVSTFDEALLLPGAMLEVWIPQSGGYVAIGGQVPTSAAEVADGTRIAAQVYKTRLVVAPLEVAGHEFAGATRWFPGLDPRGHANASPKLTCPTCSMVLPATGVCDTCG